jgi:hypothetical protein
MSVRRTIGSWLAFVAGAVTLAAAQVPAPPAPSVPRSLDIPDNALIAPGPAPEVDVLYTGDVNGFIEPCG